jgi:hypothetical protein
MYSSICPFQSSVFKRIKIYDYQAICLETEGEGSSSSLLMTVSDESVTILWQTCDVMICHQQISEWKTRSFFKLYYFRIEEENFEQLYGLAYKGE